MKNLTCKFLPVWMIVILTFVSGCGYTQKNALPDSMKTIYVDVTENKMELNDLYVYVQGLEMMITNAVVKRLKEDGNLKVVSSEKEADVVLKTVLVRLEQGGTRFTSLEAVQEYRMFVTVDAKLVNAKNDEVIWEEKDFSGDADYFVSDVRSVARQEAAERAVKRLAKNLTDRIVEDW